MWLPKQVRKGLQLSPLSLSSLTAWLRLSGRALSEPSQWLWRAQPMVVKSPSQLAASLSWAGSSSTRARSSAWWVRQPLGGSHPQPSKFPRWGPWCCGSEPSHPYLPCLNCWPTQSVSIVRWLLFYAIKFWGGFCTAVDNEIGGGTGTPLQYSCLENSMDEGA